MSLKFGKNNKNTEAQPKLSGSYKKGYPQLNYSSLLNKRVAWNKGGGRKDEPFLISVVPVISMVVGKMSYS